MEKSMKELAKALDLIKHYERKPLFELAKEFNLFSGQTIPNSILWEFGYTGLSNIDFLTSDFLIKKGFKNLIQIITK